MNEFILFSTGYVSQKRYKRVINMTCSSNDSKIMKFVKENLGIIMNAAVI